MHMNTKTDEGQKRIQKYLLENATPEVKQIPKDEKKVILKDEPPVWKDKKNDDYNEYEYSDDREADDTKW